MNTWRKILKFQQVTIWIFVLDHSPFIYEWELLTTHGSALVAASFFMVQLATVRMQLSQQVLMQLN